jgi:broad specificity phosphatase PhoE
MLEAKPEPRQSRASSAAASASGCLDSLRLVELYVLARHGESTLNFENRINGDPAVPVALTEKGREEARLLGQQVAHIRLDVCICTRFTRTRETAEIALQGRDLPIEAEPLLDDIDVGDLEGLQLEDYRAWKREHTRRDPFPGGESLDAAALRYAQAFRKLLERPQTSILVVTHEIPVRYAINAADGSDDLDGPAHQLANAMPYLFDEEALARAVDGIERLA